jgi:hypothetical protein
VNDGGARGVCSRGQSIQDQGGNSKPFQFGAQSQTRWAGSYDYNLLLGGHVHDANSPGCRLCKSNLARRPGRGNGKNIERLRAVEDQAQRRQAI